MIISGFLITQSFIYSKSIGSYLLKRVLRVIPAFAASLILIAFIVGPLITKMDVASYFTSGGKANPFAFILLNLTFNIAGYSWTPQDIFALNPFPSSANGSMWTLKHEVAMYLALPVLSFFLFFRVRILMLLMAIFTFLLVCAEITTGFHLLHLHPHFWVLGQYEYVNFIKLAYFFLAGTVFYLYSDRIYYHPRFILLAAVGIMVANAAGHLMIGLMLLLPYLVIGLAVGLKWSWFRKYGDFSYGMYIYAFPCQQTIVYLFQEHLTITSMFFSSFLLTLAIAIPSWHYLEQPILQLKGKLQDKPATEMIAAVEKSV